MIVIVCKPRKFDREADEWIAREHAKEIANNKNFLLQSMDIVGIRDTEIHNYQINLKGNGSSSITRLTPNTKMGQNSGIRQKPEAFLLGSMENEMISDGVLAQDINQASSFWLLREVHIFHSMIIFFRKKYFISFQN
ncbi:D-2-hydroxyglutarate dehydrogenase, mitochondrial-like isoform X2 [Glycine soja]|uniref:D-2-hydroxyglutarate dehydrogenase, mitochondrial-like isoform X2 n=1 Tax=Glycine soja TaxID=3848 RepID=UPI00103BB794|nr:D-2-hydroxyglutarate dehydrogenase, mitochondrial-like isoform X2 [Glycine soja]